MWDTNGFGAVRLTSTSGRIAMSSSAGGPALTSQPDGMSTLMMDGRDERGRQAVSLICLMIVLNGSRIVPEAKLKPGRRKRKEQDRKRQLDR